MLLPVDKHWEMIQKECGCTQLFGCIACSTTLNAGILQAPDTGGCFCASPIASYFRGVFPESIYNLLVHILHFLSEKILCFGLLFVY